jgi:phosphatidylinositol alpha-1,6-mannosyltransferase
VILPGVDVPEPRPNYAQSRAYLEARYRMTIGERPVVLCVGRLVERKGYIWFVQEVMPKVIAALPEALCIMCGEGPLRRPLEALIAKANLGKAVLLLGRVDSETLWHVYAAASVFVMPNIPVPGNPEGFGLVSLEARSVGTPVVVANLDGIAESVAIGEDGMVVPPMDSHQFSNAIVQVAQSQAGLLGRDQMAERIRHQLSWRVMAKKYAVVFGLNV